MARRSARPPIPKSNLVMPWPTNTPPDFRAACAHCKLAAYYVRTRHFDGSYAHVWMCDTVTCSAFGLYFHTDHQGALLDPSHKSDKSDPAPLFPPLPPVKTKAQP